MNYGKQIDELVKSGDLFPGEVEEMIARGTARQCECVLKKLAEKVLAGEISVDEITKLADG